VRSLQQVLCALTCALGSLTTPLILCVFCVRINVKTAPNVNSSYRLDHTGHGSFQSMSTLAVLSDGYWTMTITVERLLWTFVLYVNFPVCRKELWYWIIKNFHFYSSGYSITNNNSTKKALLSTAENIVVTVCNCFVNPLSLICVKFPAPRASGLQGLYFLPPEPRGLNFWRGWLPYIQRTVSLSLFVTDK